MYIIINYVGLQFWSLALQIQFNYGFISNVLPLELTQLVCRYVIYVVNLEEERYNSLSNRNLETQFSEYQFFKVETLNCLDCCQGYDYYNRKGLRRCAVAPFINYSVNLLKNLTEEISRQYYYPVKCAIALLCRVDFDLGEA